MLDWTLARPADRRGRRPHVTPPGPLPALLARCIGTQGTVRLLKESVLPTVIPADHPRCLAFVPGVPTEAAVIAELGLAAAQVMGGSRLEAGAAAAEDQAIRWLADSAGLPASAGRLPM